jgi:hypothetical protein
MTGRSVLAGASHCRIRQVPAALRHPHTGRLDFGTPVTKWKLYVSAFSSLV